ncbi:unnamed protein product [Lathyrus sativus]|nr:unnamed protein product [Lathyrus sativus]
MKTSEVPPTDDMKVTLPVETDVPALASADPSIRTDGGFSGGLSDTFVLTGYEDHVAFKLWKGEVPTCGLKLKKFSDVVMPPEVKRIIEECGLLSLVESSLIVIDSQLLTTFIERWHKETFFIPSSIW